MSLYYLILWNQVDILQKHFKKHTYVPLDEALRYGLTQHNDWNGLQYEQNVKSGAASCLTGCIIDLFLMTILWAYFEVGALDPVKINIQKWYTVKWWEQKRKIWNMKT